MKKQKKYVLGILMCMILCFLAPGINGQAATPENVMQSSRAVSGKLETTGKGVRYYNSRTGKYEKKKWLKVKNNIYYFTSKGYAKTGWKTHNGRKYYFDQKGRLVTSWQKIGKYTYYMWKNKGNLSGSAATGKVQIAKRYYYFSKKGVMETGWKKIAGYYYYFSPQTGQMAVNTTVGKYKVDSRGRRVSSTSGKKNTGKVDYWVGDSRTVGLGSALGVSKKCIAQVGMGHSWYLTTAEKKLKKVLKKNPNATVVINFGVNDHGNIWKYISSYQKLINSYPNAQIWFMSVNPIDSKYKSGYVSNKDINRFNKKLKAAFPDRYLDTNSYLKKTKFKTVDGLHYTDATYRKIYNYVLSKV